MGDDYDDEYDEEEKVQGEAAKAKPDGGYFGGEKKPKKERTEFLAGDSDEEDEANSAAYSKPTRGGGQVAGAQRGGKGRKFKLDDEDFPSL